MINYALEITILGIFLLGLLTFLILPQLRRLKQHRVMIKSLKRGDTILTNGGIYGKIKKVEASGLAWVEFSKGAVFKVETNLIYKKVN